MRSLKTLSRRSEEWKWVYKKYLMFLIFTISIIALRFVAELVISIFLIYVLYLTMSNQSIATVFSSSSSHRWMTIFIKFRVFGFAA